jgi:hypothetical protein
VALSPIPHIELRPVDKKRLAALHERSTTELKSGDIGYAHTVLTQCVLPYIDPKTRDWTRKNGDYSLMLTGGLVEDGEGGFRCVGLPYGSKPRLFQLYFCTQAIKQQTRIVSLEKTLCGMLTALGYGTSGGAHGPIRLFKEQMVRYARATITIIGPGPRGGRRYSNSQPIERFDVFFSPDPGEKDIWPQEIELTLAFYETLACHAVPFHFEALRSIQQRTRAIDAYLWLTQRLCRIPAGKPLLIKWRTLHEMFGGQSPFRVFKQAFRSDLKYALCAYPQARLEECPQGFLFRNSLPPIPSKNRLFVATKAR